MLQAQIQPWITVSKGLDAIDFYKEMLGAEQIYKQEMPDGNIVARLRIGSSEFWISQDGSSSSPSDGAVRLILIVDDPATYHARTTRAGGASTCPRPPRRRRTPPSRETTAAGGRMTPLTFDVTERLTTHA